MDNTKNQFSELNDIELVSQAQSGNTVAFEEIVSRYYPRLYQTALAILNSHHDAEEVTQDALIKSGIVTGYYFFKSHSIA